MTFGTGLVAREPLHTRQIDMRGFQRSDGLFEVEGRLIDTKPCDFTPKSGGGSVPAGQPIHDISLCIVFDDNMIVHEVRTETRAAPYLDCPAAGLAMQRLVGLSMSKGWNKAVREILAPAERCTHMAELLGPMATTAFQSLSALRATKPDAVDASGRPLKIGSCYAYHPAGALTRRVWPEFAETAGETARG